MRPSPHRGAARPADRASAISPAGARHSTSLTAIGRRSASARSISERSSSRTIGKLKIAERPADVAGPSPKSVRARSLAMTTLPSASTTSWATGLDSMAAASAQLVAGRLAAVCQSPCPAREAGLGRGPREAPSGEIRRFRSTGTKVCPWAIRVSARPRKRNPPSFRAKWKRARIRAWVSALKYIRVLRQTSRSTREIGASLDQVVPAEDDLAAEVLAEDVERRPLSRSTAPAAPAGRPRPARSV